MIPYKTSRVPLYAAIMADYAADYDKHPHEVIHGFMVNEVL